MKIGFKLTVIMIVLSLFSTGAVGITLLIQARANIISLSHEKAITTAQDYAGEIRNFFSSYWFTAETIASVMENYDTISEYNRRSFINAMLKAEVEKYDDVTGIWVIWEPDVLEGNDQRYIGTPGTTDYGRFTPYWYRDGTNIFMYALPEEEFNDPEAGDYYHVPREAGRTMLLDPYLDDVGGTMILNTTIAVPIFSRDQPRKVLGVVGIDISVDTIQKMSENHMPFGSGYTAVFSNDGTIVAHFDASRLGESMQETEQDMAGPYLDDLVEAVTNGKLFYFTHYIASAKGSFNIVATPIFIGQYGDCWNYTIAIPINTITSAVNQMLYIVIIISAIVLTLVILASVILSRSLSKPILTVTDTLKDISEGEGDLTRSIIVNSNDEIGSLAHYFNLTLEKIKNLIIVIKKQTVTLHGIGDELSGNMTDTVAAVNTITSNIRTVKDHVLNQSASVSETHATMEQMTQNINKLNKYVENQSKHISYASSAIEEMAANIQSVNGTLANNVVNVHVLKEASMVGHTGLQEVSKDIQEIARESEGILEINSVMENIASQTNLLSMNAAIEAAHAGEAGRGFAVVAAEIRKLAESSGKQSQTISNVLKKIKGSIDKITSSTENVLNRFDAINTSVRTVAEQEEVIRNAMEEQGAGSKQILEGVSNVNEITRQVQDGSRQMFARSEEVIEESTSLEKSTQKITTGMNDIALGAEHINVTINRVNAICDKNRGNIELLVREVSKFKVE
ncbi:MAG: methyl-accepting chemotaxis protein [Treponema sp.]|nr:methyl-accepting chemotaxis protein [Treponema sp.]